MSAPAMLWPVWSFANPHKPIVAWFFDYDAAVDFVTQETDRNLYIGTPKYDRRGLTTAQLEPQDVGDGRLQVAA